MEIFSGIYSRGPVQAELSDAAFLRAMVDVEVALARALVRSGFGDQAAADELAAACRDAASYDAAEIGRSTADKATPVPGLLAAIRSRVGEGASAILHRGATSQDIVDTAMMLVARRALGILLAELADAGEACATATREHRRTLMAGRTLMQQALPIPFALKSAMWLSGLTAARTGLVAVRDHVLAVQLGGAVGTLAALGDRGLDVMSSVAAQLELADPGLPWHTARGRPVRLAGALGEALGAMGKVALDLVLLAQTEVREAAEAPRPGRGGSSSMAHKRNPVGAIAVRACAERAPGLVSVVMASMAAQEHERAAGAWQGEWAPLLELLALAGSAATTLKETLSMLEVDEARMRQNLEALLRSPDVREQLAPAGPDEAPDPGQCLGVAEQMIDRALAAHEAAAGADTVG
ncbi:MAG: lyase family protein [Solirubrobacteraceae bacterium]